MKGISVVLCVILLVFGFVGVANATLIDIGDGFFYDPDFNDTFVGDGGTHFIDASNSITTGRLLVGLCGHHGEGGVPLPTIVDVINGGYLQGLYLNWGKVNINGGSAGSILNKDFLSIIDGNVGGISGFSSSHTNVQGGNVNEIHISDDGTGEIWGGVVNSIRSTVDAVIDIYGYGFNLPYGEITLTQGHLSGFLSDGSIIDSNFNREGWDMLGTINLIEAANDNSKPIPEPSTMLLLGTGLIGFAGVRRKFKK